LKTHLPTAILLFANATHVDLDRKFIPNGEKLFDYLTESTLSKARKTGLPVFHISNKEQVGTTFGQRFTTALDSVFKKGFDNIIVIGNDTPQLKTKHLKQAEIEISKGKTVIGPSVDGGFYLMGISKSNFNAADFLKLPWQQSNLLEQVLQWSCNSSQDIVKLPILQDLDVFEDLKNFTKLFKTISTRIYRLIYDLIKDFKRYFQLDALPVTQFHFSLFYNKGSPRLLRSQNQ